MITATRYHDISCGHRVVGHESKCRFLHGHNYRIHFTIEGGLDELGRVIDFGVIKAILCEWLEKEWDHRFLLWENDPWSIVTENYHDKEESHDAGKWLASHLTGFWDDTGIRFVPFNPTAENMAEYLLNVVGPELLPNHVRLIRVRIDETRKCSAEASL
jgi:6-pyruvoyltetrahydropterin/6-carboxytetrahydropterin synthase